MALDDGDDESRVGMIGAIRCVSVQETLEEIYTRARCGGKLATALSKDITDAAFLPVLCRPQRVHISVEIELAEQRPSATSAPKLESRREGKVRSQYACS